MDATETVRLRAALNADTSAPKIGMLALPSRFAILGLRNAQALTLQELSRDLPERSGLARDGKLAPGGMAGGTFTVNNYGVFGINGSEPSSASALSWSLTSFLVRPVILRLIRFPSGPKPSETAQSIGSWSYRRGWHIRRARAS